MSARSLKGLVLAGGKGTRLRPLTYTTAKQLVPVANRPILWYALDSLIAAGIDDLGIVISPETGEAIQTSVAQWCPDHVKTTFIMQTEPAGLAHAVQTAKTYLADSAFVMYLGDNLIQSALLSLVEDFCHNTADAQILLKAVENPQAFGVAELDTQGRVIGLMEKPENPKSNLALVGVYLFTPVIFDAIATISPSPRGELEITDAIEMLIRMGKTVQSNRIEGWWLDTGKKDDLLAANRIVLDDYCQTHIQGRVDDRSQIRGGVEIGKNTTVQNSIIQGPVRIDEDCTIEDAYIGPYTSIGKTCRIIKAEVENSVFLKQCEVNGLQSRLEQSLLGEGCILTKAHGRPAAYRLMLGDHAVAEIG